MKCRSLCSGKPVPLALCRCVATKTRMGIHAQTMEPVLAVEPRLEEAAVFAEFGHPIAR
jgi:hypothetical protein